MRYERYDPALRREAGFALWYVLACTSGLVLIALATMATGSLALRSELRNLAFLQCRTIAFSVARAAEDVLGQGGRPPAFYQTHLAGHPVSLTSSISGKQVTVAIRVTAGTVSDTMSFVYDTSVHGVTSWQDNGPRS